MAEPNFVLLGHKQGEEFIEGMLQGVKVIDSRGVSVEAHQTNDGIHLTAAQAELIANAIQASQKGAVNGVAPLDASGKIPAQYIESVLADCKLIADDYDALLALSVSAAALKTTVFVSDASGDPTVESGWAVYFRKSVDGGDSSDWVKLMEGEGLDIDFNAFVKQTEKGAANGVATLGGDGTIPNAQIKAASTGQKGISQLSNETNSEDEDKAATPKAVKIAYDAAQAAQSAASTADGKAVSAQNAADAAQSTADSAVTAAATADGKAVAAQGTADTALTNAAAAQSTADGAATEAALLDAAYCTSVADMQSKNLRDGALVFMAVQA